MHLFARNPAGSAIALGIFAGASFGLDAAWLPLHVCLLLLFWLLSQNSEQPALAAKLVANFVAAMVAAGHVGFALTTPAELRLQALLPLLALVLANGLCAWSLSWVAFRLAIPEIFRMALLLPSLWVMQEWLFSFSDFAIPWIRLGYAQAPDGPLAGTLSLGGVLLASWAMLAVTGAAVTAACAGTQRARWNAGLLIAICLTASAILGLRQWTQETPGLDVMLVQSGVATEDKIATAATSRLQNLYFDAARRSHVDLIIGSQLAIPKVVQALPPAYLADLGELLHGRRADMLLGVYFRGADAKRPFNGVLSIGHSGLQRYLKQNLFPWGEYLPAWEWLQAMLPRPGLGMSRAPEGQGALVSGVHRLAIAICFEAAFGDTWSRQAATADVLVNVSSDSAVKSGQLARQFQRIVQTRAMELQKPLVRTSDIRGSYFVDPFGRLGATAPAGEYSEVQQRISGRHGLTPYARWGDAFVLALAVSVMGIALYLVLRRSDLTAALVGVALTGAAPQRQLGQVLPAGMALLLIIGGTFYLMVNAGQSISEKIRVTNAADAAAYSAGLVEARALNYDAYINRAMVANQIAMAQMLSFTSWVNYAAKATENYPNAETEVNEFLLPNPDVAVLDAAFFGGGIAASFSGTSPAEFAQRVNSVVGAFITASDLAVQMMALTQPLVQLNLTAGIRQQQIAESVVKAMDSKLTAEVVLVSHGFDTFTKGYAKGGAGGDLRGRFADVTVRSRDAFTRERNWTVDSFDIPLVRQNGALKKRGGTDLIGYDEWRAVDTLELHGQRFGCGKWGLSWCDDIQRPVGWGSSEVDAGTGDAGQGTHGNAYGENRRTAGRADAAMSAPDSARYHGIPNSWDLSDVDTKTEPSTAITVRVSKAHGDTLTSGNAAKAKAAGKLAVFGDHPAGGQLAALSRAQVYFDRISPRKDGRTELGSLYNPYWRVRLVAPTAADKLYAATQQGNLALP